MVKYLEVVINRLKSFKSGLENNTSVWSGQSETPEKVQQKIDELDTKGRDIDKAESDLRERRAEARMLSESGEKYADKLENLTLALHDETPEKLTEYSVVTRKKGSRIPKPSKVLIPIIEDDTDGVGFIISTQFDGDATNYQWFKGASTDPKDTRTVPEMREFKVTMKTTFVDDDVEKGVRYFYKVQAFNTHGTGPMSEAVSRVQ